ASIAVDGIPIAANPELRYFAFNKPRGVTSTLADRHAGRSLAGFLPPGPRGLPGRPIGSRLRRPAVAHERRRAGQSPAASEVRRGEGVPGRGGRRLLEERRRPADAGDRAR